MVLGWGKQELHYNHPEKSDVSTTKVCVSDISALTPNLEILEISSKIKKPFHSIGGNRSCSLVCQEVIGCENVDKVYV